MAKQSKGEMQLAFQLNAFKIAFEQEWKFHPTRRWRFDFALPDKMLAIEVEGGVWLGSKGRHTSGKGYINDMSKYNEASQLGWKVLRFTPQQVKSGYAINEIIKTIA
jgi:very-short-patch-repair endonuclease